MGTRRTGQTDPRADSPNTEDGEVKQEGLVEGQETQDTRVRSIRPTSIGKMAQIFSKQHFLCQSKCNLPNLLSA